MVATLTGMIVAQGWRVGRQAAVLVAGLAIYAVGDGVYALRLTYDTYVVGTLLDGTWAIGMCLIALWVHR